MEKFQMIELTLVAIGAGLLLGVTFGLVSSSADAPTPASPMLAWSLRLAGWITIGYVTFFRGTPLFVQILLVHFALMPALVHPDGGLLMSGDVARTFRQEHGAFFSDALALTLNAGAYISEIFRAGIQSIHRGQTQAAYSVGLTGLILVKILAPGFYARQNVATPVRIGVVTLAAKIRKGRGFRYDTRVVDACLKLFRDGRFSFKKEAQNASQPALT